MRCADARAALWPPEQPRLAVETVLEARAHLARCPECAAWLRQDRVLLDAYRRLSDRGAPDGVRERVFDALARERAGGGRAAGGRQEPVERAPGASDEERRRHEGRRQGHPPTGRMLLAGSGLLAALLAGLLLMQAGGTPPEGAVEADAGEVFLQDHLRRAVGEDHILTSDPAAVRTFLARELGVSVTTLIQAGLELEGAEICLLEGERGAVIIYRRDGARISHYLLPRPGAEPREARLARASSVAPGGLLPVVTWTRDRVEQALVGEVPAAELLRIAEAGGA